MNINNTQNQNAQCCIDYCSRIFSDGEQTVVNSYKCEGKKISSASVWDLQKQRKEVSVRNYGL
jgi:hypothetical protein